MLAKAIGATGDDIMFSSNDTPMEEFQYAHELNAIINLDDITHIEFLEKAIGTLPKKISCRYNPGGLFKISNDIMDNPGDAKYGMTTEQIDLRKTIPVITANVYIDKDGNYHQYSEDSFKEQLNQYSILQYNHLSDYKNRVNDFFGG